MRKTTNPTSKSKLGQLFHENCENSLLKPEKSFEYSQAAAIMSSVVLTLSPLRAIWRIQQERDTLTYAPYCFFCVAVCGLQWSRADLPISSSPSDGQCSDRSSNAFNR